MDLINIAVRAALAAVEDSKPVAIMYGVVEKTTPLSVQIEQRLTLGMSFLTLTENMRQKLEVGDKLLLLRKQGGQEYIVLDRM